MQRRGKWCPFLESFPLFPKNILTVFQTTEGSRTRALDIAQCSLRKRVPSPLNSPTRLYCPSNLPCPTYLAFEYVKGAPIYLNGKRRPKRNCCEFSFWVSFVRPNLKSVHPFSSLECGKDQARRGGGVVGYQYTSFLPPGIPIYL